MRAGKSAELNKKHKTETIFETKQQKQKPNKKKKWLRYEKKSSVKGLCRHLGLGNRSTS